MNFRPSPINYRRIDSWFKALAIFKEKKKNISFATNLWNLTTSHNSPKINFISSVVKHFLSWPTVILEYIDNSLNRPEKNITQMTEEYKKIFPWWPLQSVGSSTRWIQFYVDKCKYTSQCSTFVPTFITSKQKLKHFYFFFKFFSRP